MPNAMTSIESVTAVQGNLYEVRGEDGIYVYANWFVEANIGKRRFVHGTTFGPHQAERAQNLAQRVESKGTIDLQHWIEIEVGPTLEERLGPYGIEWENEQMDRMGMGDNVGRSP